MLWQLSYLDSEIGKILQTRFSAARRATAPGDKKKDKVAAVEGKKTVPRMKLEPDEVCCVCHEEMKETENLTFCKSGCGRNIHVDCIEVWVKHKVSQAQKITCPLCRTDWGPNALEELREETKQFREKRAEEVKVKSKEKAKDERSFKCYCCKRTLIFEARL
jgi:hypothetical protein